MRSYDQYGNIFLENAHDRRIVQGDKNILTMISTISSLFKSLSNLGCYSDYELGSFVVRGENVVIMGELKGWEKVEGDGNQNKKKTNKKWQRVQSEEDFPPLSSSTSNNQEKEKEVGSQEELEPDPDPEGGVGVWERMRRVGGEEMEELERENLEEVALSQYLWSFDPDT